MGLRWERRSPFSESFPLFALNTLIKSLTALTSEVVCEALELREP